MLTIAQKIGQLFFIGLQGAVLSAEEKSFILKNNIGGIILFTRNFKTLEQLIALTKDIHSLQSQKPDKLPTFIGVDFEGGRVARFKEPFTIWPPLKKLGDLDSALATYEFAEKMGEELKAAGINVNFAPCVDVLTNPKNTVIGDRSLGADSELVSKLASALVRGYVKAGIIPCPKHFPGHGDTLLDSHEDLPVQNETDLKTLQEREFSPFKKALRARAEMIMSAHILFPKIDPEWPATLSKKFLTDILRGEFRYKDLIITDDLDMKALRKKYPVEKIAVRALEAGADLLLYCNEPQSPAIALEAIQKAIKDKTLDEKKIDESYARVLKVKSHSLAQQKAPSFIEAKKIIGNKSHKELAQNIKDGVLPKNSSQTA